MATRAEQLVERLQAALPQLQQPVLEFDEVTLSVSAAELIGVCEQLKTDSTLAFAQLIDLCGVDYAS